MILDPVQLDADELRCQVCIIGAGAAGIALALELGRHKLDVVLVGGGDYQQGELDRRLSEGVIDPPGSHEPLDENRHRAFGGSTKVWGGRLVPFDSIDFESRDYVPMSGWPIAYEEVARHFPRAAKLCEVVTDGFCQSSRNGQFDFPDSLGDGAIETTSCERWSPPTDFGVAYRSALAAMDNVRVLMGYHAVDLHLLDGLQRADRVQLVSRRGRAVRVAADVFILATGGLENARLLLASRGQLPEGVGNHSDMVGRCYMSHLAGTYGRLRLNGGHKPSFYHLSKDAQGAYHRRRFRLADFAQREFQVMNVIGFPNRPAIDDPRHRDAVLSLVYLQDALLRLRSRGRPEWTALGRHLGNVALNSPAAWLSAARQLWLRTARPRLPLILPYRGDAQDALFFQAEQAPNRESRLQLSECRDEFGVPRIAPRVRLSEVDYRTVKVFYRQLDLALRTERLGRLEYDEAELDAYLGQLTTNFNSCAHHVGTTRMSADPARGVVNSDCRVHCVGNLYVAGSSVFPTSGHANPTLTLLALTLRLADHVSGLFRPERQALVEPSTQCAEQNDNALV